MQTQQLPKRLMRKHLIVWHRHRRSRGPSEAAAGSSYRAALRSEDPMLYMDKIITFLNFSLAGVATLSFFLWLVALVVARGFGERVSPDFGAALLVAAYGSLVVLFWLGVAWVVITAVRYAIRWVR